MYDLLFLTYFQSTAEIDTNLCDLLLRKLSLRNNIGQAGQIFHSDKDIPSNFVFVFDDLEILDLNNVGSSTQIHHNCDLANAVVDQLFKMRLRCRVASLLRKNCFYFTFVLRNRDDLHS